MRCQACLGSLNSTPENSTMTTRCGHLFHINCIDSWLNDGNQTCPRCRSMISRNELIQLYSKDYMDSVEVRKLKRLRMKGNYKGLVKDAIKK